MLENQNYELKNKARSMFVEGYTLALIAEELNIKFKTLQQWHTRGEWSKLRQEAEEKAKNLLVEKAAQNKVKTVEEYITPLLNSLSQKATEVLQRESEDFSSRDILIPLAQLLKLKAQITGEIYDTKSISPVSELWRQWTNEPPLTEFKHTFEGCLILE